MNQLQSIACRRTLDHLSRVPSPPSGGRVRGRGRAANDGIVSFAESELSGLGKMVVIDHGNGFQTVYAHNEKNLVKVGETVKRSDIIALVGSTGRAAEPFLHFEIRKNHRPVDPLEYLR